MVVMNMLAAFVCLCAGFVCMLKDRIIGVVFYTIMCILNCICFMDDIWAVFFM